MILPDVNVLLAAYRSDHTHHRQARVWLELVVRGDEPFGLCTQVLGAVVRIATNRRAYPQPSDPRHALGFCTDLLDQPHAVRVEPGERHWAIFSRFVADGIARGALVTDAWFAALAIEWGCEWITFDRDYARFPGLKWRQPG